MTCVRRAWLTLPDGSSVDLEDEAAGYFCTSLDLGSPDVRAVVNNRPDADGIDDYTRYMGGRAITADLTALAGAGAQIDAVPLLFARFMLPSARPVLHYILDRLDATERTLIVRPAGFDFKVEGDQERDLQLAFVAANPVAQGATQESSVAYAGSATTPGRLYALTFPRTYPAGGNSASTGVIHSNGDVAVKPLLTFYGPITGGAATFHVPGGATYRVGFLSTFVIGPGAYVVVDTDQKTARYNGDPAQNVLASLDFSTLTWPVLPPGVDNTMTVSGTATSGVSQVVAQWTDGYLS